MSASLVIVVVGKTWLSVSDEFGRRRIDLPDDWVRREIEAALQSGKKILPLLIEGAELPTRDALPSSIAPLLEIQARRMNIGSIAKDMAALVKDAGIWIDKKPIVAEIPYPYPLLKIKPLDEQNLQRLETRLPAWRVVSRQSDKGDKVELMRTFEFESFPDLIHFMSTASKFIDRIDHHPEWTNIWRTLIVYLTTWDIGFRPSMLDVDLAAYLDDLHENYVKKISRHDIDLIIPNSAG